MQKRVLGSSGLEVSALWSGLHGNELVLWTGERQEGDDLFYPRRLWISESPSSTQRRWRAAPHQ